MKSKADKLRKKIEQLQKLYDEVNGVSSEIDELLQGTAEFEIGITFCGGDRVLLINIGNHVVANYAPCLLELEKTGSISFDTFDDNSI